MTLMGFFVPAFGTLGEMNETVSSTSISLLMVEEMDIETEVATLTNTALNDNPAIVSSAAALPSNVEMTRSSFAAAEDDGRTSP